MDSQPYHKKVINSLIDTTNIMEFDEFVDLAVDTFDSIISIIEPLCGKYACKNMIVYENINDDISKVVFSNDGIHILKSIEFMSPIQVYIINYLVYIASRVESAAADGTSTAIYLACHYFRELLLSLKRSREKNSLRATMLHAHKLRDRLCDDLDAISFYIDKMSIDLNEADQLLRHKLIHDLAMITSKGNKVLSEYVTEYFENVPSVLYKFAYFDRSTIESDEEFIVEKPEYDFKLNSITSQRTVFNSRMFTEFDNECDLLIIYKPIDVELGFLLLEYLDNRDEHTVVLYKEIGQSEQYTLESKIDPGKVTLVRNTSHTPDLATNPIELMTVLASAGKKEPTEFKTTEDFDNILIKNVRCVINNNSITIFNLVEAFNDYLNNLFVSKRSTFYNKLERNLREALLEEKDKHVKKDLSLENREFVRIYRNMVGPRLPVLKIGGLSTKHLANINVVEDTIGAVSVAMEHGVVVDMIPKLFAAGKFDQRLALPGIVKYMSLIYGTDIVNTEVYPDKTNMFKAESFLPIDLNEDLIVQSTKAMKETIRRMKEVATELVLINDVIVPNGVVTKETNDGNS